MTDVRAEDDDRLPWLEAVEDEEERGPSPIKLIAAVLIGLVAIGIVVGGLFWFGNRGSGGGNEELIASPGDYKVRPPEAGGMRVDNSSATQVATTQGAEPQGRLNQAAQPEAPVTQPQAPAAQAPATAQPAPARSQPAPAAGQAQRPAAPAPQPRPQAPAQARPTGPTIQVGAYPSEAAANGEWARLSQRYPYLGSLQRNVTVYQRGNQTFYRLRASGGEAAAVCRRLRAAGQPCMDVN